MQPIDRQYGISGRDSGFTLVELLMVVAIITLIGSLSGGLYVKSYQKMLVEKAARQFLLTARYARIVAIEKQRPYELEIDAQEQAFALTTTQWNEETGQSEKIIVRNYYCRPVKLAEGVTFENVQMTDGTDEPEEGLRIVFKPNGSAESAMIQIGDGNHHYTVSTAAATGKAVLYAGPMTESKPASIDLDTL